MAIISSRWAASPVWEHDRKISTARKCKAAATSKHTNIGGTSEKQDYYEILGVSSDASSTDIRKAYRQLQKKHHPDIFGAKGHDMTLLLNEAYQTLIDERLRAKYNSSFPHLAAGRIDRDYSQPSSTDSIYSSWNGPDRPQGLFVDENSCIGCRQCAFAARNTFSFDDSTACARVKTQWGDPEEAVKVAVQTCPVNCIHWVERSDLRTLEYLIRPKQKPSNGVFGGEWERPSNIFMAAKTFKHQQQQQQTAQQSPQSSQYESPAQKNARREAELKLRVGPLWSLFSWMTETTTSSAAGSTTKSTRRKPLFGTSCTSEIFSFPLEPEARSKTIQMMQEWAVNFASSSELPLPMPFQADSVENGVRLKLITAGDGVLSSVGSFLITVETQEAAANAEDSAAAAYFLCITRHGTTDSGSLPGENRILKLVQDLLLHKNNYAAYHIPWTH